MLKKLKSQDKITWISGVEKTVSLGISQGKDHLNLSSEFLLELGLGG